MQQRLPLVLSSTALVVALFGATPLGNAARDLVHAIPPFAKKAGYAKNAGAVNGIHASRTAKPGDLVPLDSNGKLPASANPGETVVVRTGSTVMVPAAQQGTTPPTFGVADAFAQCNPGEHMTGGGGEVTNAGATFGLSQQLMSVNQPNPNNANGWFIRVVNGYPQPVPIVARVVCASP